jgi:hypothetical protein
MTNIESVKWAFAMKYPWESWTVNDFYASLQADLLPLSNLTYSDLPKNTPDNTVHLTLRARR